MKNRKSNARMVADQPGLPFLVTGFLIALFLGLSLRFALSQERVTDLINKAASHVGAGFQIEFSNARVVFSEGWLPRLRVAIAQARFRSDDVCLLSPDILLEELSIPISFSKILMTGEPVEKIQVKNVVIHFRTALQDCNQPLQKKGSQAKKVFQGIRIAQDPVQRRGVEALLVDQVDFIYDPNPELKTTLTDIQVTQKNQGSEVSMSAHTNLIKDEGIGDYLSHGEVHLKYQGGMNSRALVHFFGNILEGRYSLIGDFDLTSKKMHLQSDVHHIPVVQVFNFLKKYQLTKEVPEIQDLWISFKAEMSSPLEKLSQSTTSMKDVLIEGAQGQITSDSFELNIEKPYLKEAVTFEVTALDLDYLSQLKKNFQYPKRLKKMGQLSGSGKIEPSGAVSVNGSIINTNFVYSWLEKNHQFQIDEMKAQAVYDGQKWQGRLSDFNTTAGNWSGELAFNIASTFEQAFISGHIESDSIRSDFSEDTFGNIKVTASDVDFLFEKKSDKNKKISIQWSAPEAFREGLKVIKPSLSYKEINGEVSLQFSSVEGQMEVDLSEPFFAKNKDLIQSLGLLEKEDNLKYQALLLKSERDQFSKTKGTTSVTLLSESKAKERLKADWNISSSGAIDGRVQIESSKSQSKLKVFKGRYESGLVTTEVLQ